MGCHYFAFCICIAGSFQVFIFLKNELFLEKNRTNATKTTTLYRKNIILSVNIDRKCLVFLVLGKNRCFLVYCDTGLYQWFGFLDVDISIALVIVQLIFFCAGNFFFSTWFQHFVPTCSLIATVSPCTIFYFKLIERSCFVRSLYI